MTRYVTLLSRLQHNGCVHILFCIKLTKIWQLCKDSCYFWYMAIYLYTFVTGDVTDVWPVNGDYFSVSALYRTNFRLFCKTIHALWLLYFPDLKRCKKLVYLVSYFGNRWHFSEVPNLIMEAIAKHDFTATADDELSFRKNQVLKVRLRSWKWCAVNFIL